jgi:carbohydrate diacid regulator
MVMRINKLLAQDIADKIMQEIPYNVNIMNEKGVIIGSGQKERIGTLHNGAARAIEDGNMVIVYQEKADEKPGVNIPITFQNEIIGVVGISGDPTIVTSLAAIVKVTVELLIEQDRLHKEQRVKEKMEGDFLFQWTTRIAPYGPDFISQGRAVEIDVLEPRFALVVKGGMMRKPSILSSGEYVMRFDENTHIYLLKSGKNLEAFLPKIIENGKVYIGVGKEEPIISTSIQQAINIITITEKMKWDHQIVYYEKHQLIDHLLQSDIDISEIVAKFRELAQSDKGMDFIETLKCYIENNGNINEVSHLLHIHRNSLNYRLDRIETIFQLDPRKYEDLFTLYTGLIFYYCKN